MDTFNVNMKRDMQAMGTVKNASIFAKNENALPGAYTMYLNSAQQPIAYFGPGYQDIFTYVHEQGHYLAARYLVGMPRSVDFAELHSQGNEWLFMAYLDGVVDEKIYKGLLLDNLVNGLSTIISCTVTDHFEEMIYKNDYTLMADAYRGVMDLVWTEYPGLQEILSKVAGYDFYEYVLRVSLLQPGYYLSYATSQMASMSLYAIAQEQGYQAAQNVYVKLQEGIDPTLDFLPSIEAAGLRSPLEVATYQSLENVLLGKKQNA
jgi:oligoendopeptidase F